MAYETELEADWGVVDAPFNAMCVVAGRWLPGAEPEQRRAGSQDREAGSRHL
jgi:hypothetical protein